MIFTARSRPVKNASLAFGLIVLGLAAMQPAAARQDDRNQKIDVHSKTFDGAQQPNSVSTLTGNVIITQGTLKATSAKGRIYFDADSNINRIVLDGTPAKIQQEGDDGIMMYGNATNIDYDTNKGIAVLTGDAFVQQQGKGEAHADHLVYNTQNSTMQGDSTGEGQVHMTFQPKPKTDAAAAKPAAPATPPAKKP
jgi:lipopolysaccharide export system protein LptA